MTVARHKGAGMRGGDGGVGRDARFRIGELVYHKLFHYRGVVLDVDPQFALSERWYRTVARTRPPKDRPWYRVLVHGASHETYVAERNLTVDSSREPIRHPALGAAFSRFENGAYVPRRLVQ